MKRFFLIMAGIFGASGVALGALGAHFIKNKIGHGIDVRQFEAFDTAAKYQLFHAIALLLLFFADKDKKHKWIGISANLFVIGIILFSGSLYFLSTQGLTGIQIQGFLGPVTPLGGVALIGGWAFLVVHAFTLKSERKP